MRLKILLLSLLLASLACNALLPASATRPTASAGAPAASAAVATRTRSAPTATARPSGTELPAETGTPALDTPLPPPEGVRACDFDPLRSVPAEMPAEVLAGATPVPYLPGPLPTNTPVDAATTKQQLKMFHDLVQAIEDEYVYPDFNGLAWPATIKKYEDVIAGGLTEESFYATLSNLIIELGDEHSAFLSPTDVAADASESAGHNEYVGIGVVVQPMPAQGYGVIVYTFLGGPAADAGLKAHDIILAVDGEPLLDESGYFRDIIRGPEGSQVTLTLRRPGAHQFDLTLERRAISSPEPVSYCMIPRTRVAYVFLPGLADETTPDQLRDALRAMTADGPLDGVILDNRENGGGSSTVVTGVLGLFTHGTVGYFVNRQDRFPMRIDAEDIGGTQDVPMVVLVGQDTASFGEIMSGVLQSQGRATVAGETTLGNVEILYAYDFDDGSRAWLAHDTFQPIGGESGQWEISGIIPEVVVPTRWDLFTEASDPAIAAALQVFSQTGKVVPALPAPR